MNDIVNELEQKNLENTTNEKKWIRNCPKCNKEILYSYKRCFDYANKENRTCRSCSCLNKYIGPFIRKCSKCDCNIVYKYYRTLYRAEKNNGVCRVCCGEKIGKSQIGRISAMKGKRFSKEHREKISKALTGIIRSNETCQKISASHIGRKRSIESRIKRRINRIRDLNIISGKYNPAYNKEACNYFQRLNMWNGWDGKHALNGGEYHIKELNYWVDYYEPTKNIVIEWDERHHYKGGKLRDWDIKRQEEIIKYLKCDFYRIKKLTNALEMIDYTQSKDGVII